MSRRHLAVTVLASEGAKNHRLEAIVVADEQEFEETVDVTVARLVERLLEETRRRGLEFRGIVTRSMPA